MRMAVLVLSLLAGLASLSVAIYYAMLVARSTRDKKREYQTFNLWHYFVINMNEDEKYALRKMRLYAHLSAIFFLLFAVAAAY